MIPPFPRRRKNRIALAPAFAHYPPMLARVLSAALSRHSLPWETTVEVAPTCRAAASCPPQAWRRRMAEAEAFPVEVDVKNIDMAEVKGQESVKRALEIAAAGGHNVLMLYPISLQAPSLLFSEKPTARTGQFQFPSHFQKYNSTGINS